jgi:hypothetical protein
MKELDIIEIPTFSRARGVFFAAPGRVLVARILDPTARRGDPGGRVPDPRRILPILPEGGA